MSIEITNLSYNSNLSSTKSTKLSNTSNKIASFSDVLNSTIKNTKTTKLDQIFEREAEKYQVPLNLLKAVAKAESNFNPMAESSAGAQGIMQLMPATAKSLGVSDSYDVEQNIMGGAKYLGQMLEKFDGNTKLALAAYNAGPGNVLKYNGVPPFTETQNYVKKVMGYCGGDVSSVALEDNLKTSTIGSEQLGQNVGSLPLIGENLDINDYELMMKLYQYKLQLNVLASTDSIEISPTQINHPSYNITPTNYIL